MIQVIFTRENVALPLLISYKNELYQVTCSTLYGVNNFGLRWLYMSFKREQIEMIGLWAKKVKCILYLIK